MNLFALTRDSSRRVVRFPLSAEVQKDITGIFDGQESDFRTFSQEEIAFDGKYKPDLYECLVINDFDDIDNLQGAIASPLSVPEISTDPREFESIKAVFTGRIAGATKTVLLQSFDKRRVLSTKGYTFFHSDDVYKKIDGPGLSLDTRLTAILENEKLMFFSFFHTRNIFDLTQYYKEATDDDLRDFAKIPGLKVGDLPSFLHSADTWVRRKVALLMQSAILDKVYLTKTKDAAAVFGIEIKLADVDGSPALVLPDDKKELKKVLRFLDEDYFQSVLLSTPHLSSSKRQITV